MIRSSTFSFVRFEHPKINDVSLDIPYSLPVYKSHNIGFHFIVDVDRPKEQAIKLGIADTDGVFQTAFNPAAFAVNLNYRYRFTGVNNIAVFDLQYITIGQKQVDYAGRIVTPSIFKQLLEDDFGVELIEDYIVLDTIQDVRVLAFVGNQPIWPNSGYRSPQWHEGYVSVTNAPVTETGCFTYALLNDNNTVIGYTNLFKVVTDSAYTSLVTYRCFESAFDFTYERDGGNAFGQRANMVRLPFYLLKPDWPSKKVVNRQSNGRTQLLSSLMEKQYAIETEHMPEVFHECMRAMLLHDELTIECSNIREKKVEVLESDNYAVAWNDDLKLSYAPAKGTVKVASFGYANSNC